MIDIARLRELAEKATPGPWTTKRPEHTADGFSRGVIVAATAPRQGIYADPPGGTYPAADQDFIAALNPQAVLALLTKLETVRAQVETLFDAIAHGDDKHRAWLKQAIPDHFAGKVVERVEGVNSAEAIAAARAQVEAMRKALRDARQFALDMIGDEPDPKTKLYWRRRFGDIDGEIAKALSPTAAGDGT